MDDLDVATAIVSVSAPEVHLDPAVTGADAVARSWARKVNEFAAELVKDHPDRFGFFATLTLPDVAGAIAEAEYAFDVLGTDGVILLAMDATRLDRWLHGLVGPSRRRRRPTPRD
jgi:6-methylsalicylate decarboxylase